jgi:hypothetical protein
VVPLALGFDRETTEGKRPELICPIEINSLANAALLATPYMFQYFRYTPTWLQRTLFRGKTDHYRRSILNYLAVVEKVVAGAQLCVLGRF